MTTDWNKSGLDMDDLVETRPGAKTPVRRIRPEDIAEPNFPMMALELENLRLTRLVAELLMKNQQLRAKMKAA